jgi:hypothetical protein
MTRKRLHAPKLPGLLQAVVMAVVVASGLTVVHYRVGISVQSDTALDRLSVNTQVTGLLVASFGGSAVAPAAARSGDIPGMEPVRSERGRSYRPPARYLATIWAGNLVLLALLFYLPVRWWHDRRYRRAVASGRIPAPAV